jgi:VCBS repeat-containing protein
MADAIGATSSAIATITIQGANDAPLATTDTATTNEDQVLVVAASGVLASDTDVDADDTKTVVAINAQSAAVGTQITLASGALLTVQSDGSYRYDPNGKFESLRANQTATDSFGYTLTDSSGATASATVTITIQGANDAPLAVNDTASTGENQVLVILTSGVLANDTDADAGDTKTVVAVNGQAAAVGTQITLASGALLTAQADGNYRYDPNGKFESLRVGQSATDSFTYTLVDGQAATSSALVTITIQGANDGPLAVNDVASTGEDQLLIVGASGVLTNDTDVDVGDTKTVAAVNAQSAAVGTQIMLASGALLLVQADGSYRYDPNGRYSLLLIGQAVTDHFSYTLVDSRGVSATAVVTVTIFGVTVPNSFAGSVYVDVNNNGVRGGSELGLPHVMVRVEGPVSRTVQTDINGNYRFDGLPKGTYTVREAHPQDFTDGLDTRGQPLLGEMANDQFVGIHLISDVHAEGYHFGERGLRNPNKKLELASSTIDWDTLLPKLPEDQLDALWAQRVGIPSSSIVGIQNPRHPLDVSNDGHITPLDALLVINELNAGSRGGASRLAASLSAAPSSGPYLDTSGDGVVSPIDALTVINYLNSRSGGGEGEAIDANAPSIPARTGGQVSSTPEEALAFDSFENWSSLNSLLDLLAEDINQARRKKG